MVQNNMRSSRARDDGRQIAKTSAEETSSKRVFDPPCARPDIAIKAIFLLWRRGKWELLLDLFPGIEREEIEARMQAFDDKYIEGEGRIRTEEQVFALVKTWPMQRWHLS